MKFLLNLFSAESLIMFIADYLTETVKNPNSDKARRIYRVVQTLHNVTTRYLNTVTPPQ